MSNYIRLINNEEIWPYDIIQLKNDFPQTSFSSFPCEEDLIPYGVFFVQPSPCPVVNSLLEKVQEIKPVFTDGKYIQSWTTIDLTEEEKLQLQIQNKPEADWKKFKNILMSNIEVNTLLSSAMAIAPAAALGLTTSLIQISTGTQNLDDFRGAWVILRRFNLISDQLRMQIKNIAEECNLPENFNNIL